MEGEVEHGKLFGFDYCILEHPRMKHLLGYLAVPADHPWFRKDYNKINCTVHGGLTFAGDNDGYPYKAEGDVWWVGFDCAHSYDRMPGMEAIEKEKYGWEPLYQEGATYKDRDYVFNEIMKMAEQASAVYEPYK